MEEQEFSTKPSNKENIKAYSEACSTLRHYSTLSFNVRVLVLIQGLVLMGVWIGGYHSIGPKGLVLISVIGCGFTYLLFNFYKGYYIATDFLFKSISKMEEILFDENYRPFLNYMSDHTIRYKKAFKRILFLYAPFLFIGLSFIVMLTISLINLCGILFEH